MSIPTKRTPTRPGTEEPAFISLNPMITVVGKGMDVAFLNSRLWHLPVHARYREPLGEMGVRRCWQLTWFPIPLLIAKTPDIPEEQLQNVQKVYRAHGTTLGAQLMPAERVETIDRLVVLLSKAQEKSGIVENYSAEILPLVLRPE